MTRDEEVLRRALRSAADSIEPAADGLIRIREKVSARRRSRLSWLLASGTGLAGFSLLRLQSAGTRLAELLRTVAEPMLAWFADEGPRHARHRQLWRRPAVAIGAVVFIAAAAGIAASGLPSEIAQSSSSNAAAHNGGAVGGRGSSGLNGSGQPYGSPTAGRTGPTPTPSCSRSPSKVKNPGLTLPGPSPTSSPSPSSAPSPTSSPSQSATPTPSPTDTSAGTSISNLQGTLPGSPDQAGGSSTGSGDTQAVGASRLTGSGSATRSPSPSPSASC
jgi:hypothetical protein